VGAETPRELALPREAAHERPLRRSVLVNLVGLGAKIVQPVLFISLTRMFGPVTMGLYFLATTIGEMAASVLTVGSLDAMVIFGSRHAENTDDPDAESSLYGIIAQAFSLGIGISLVVMALGVAAADQVATLVHQPHAEMARALRLFAPSIPLVAFSSTAVAATKIRMHMEYDVAILSFGRPLVTLVAAFVVWRLGGGLAGLMIATVVSHVVAAVASAVAFALHFEPRRVIRALSEWRLDPTLVEFSAAQSLNATVKRYLSRLNVIVLAGFGYSAENVALYSTGALLASNLREIEVALSGAFAPVVARYQAVGDRAALDATLARCARVAFSISVPGVVVLMAFEDDVFSLVHSSYRDDARFLLPLLLPIVVSSASGLAGYFLVAMGHHRVAAGNALAALVLSTSMSVVWIPAHGLFGAAVATFVSASVIAVLEAFELSLLDGLRPFPLFGRRSGRRSIGSKLP
jgi:O-antigen/teichoic acid export membrane protein